MDYQAATCTKCDLSKPPFAFVSEITALWRSPPASRVWIRKLSLSRVVRDCEPPRNGAAPPSSLPAASLPAASQQEAKDKRAVAIITGSIFSPAAGCAQVIPNLKSSTIEEAVARKKTMHVGAFRFLLEELAAALRRMAQEQEAEKRLAADPTKQYANVETLLGSIERQCGEVLAEHAGLPPDHYVQDEAFRALATAMLETRSMAMAKLRWWLEDATVYIGYLVNQSLLFAQRGYVAFIERRMAAASDEEERRSAALEACKLRGLVKVRVDEVDADDEPRLVRAAGDGAGAADLRLLLAAGAGAVPRVMVLALAAAANQGRAESVLALLEGKADAGMKDEVKILCWGPPMPTCDSTRLQVECGRCFPSTPPITSYRVS